MVSESIGQLCSIVHNLIQPHQYPIQVVHYQQHCFVAFEIQTTYNLMSKYNSQTDFYCCERNLFIILQVQLNFAFLPSEVEYCLLYFFNSIFSPYFPMFTLPIQKFNIAISTNQNTPQFDAFQPLPSLNMYADRATCIHAIDFIIIFPPCCSKREMCWLGRLCVRRQLTAAWIYISFGVRCSATPAPTLRCGQNSVAGAVAVAVNNVMIHFDEICLSFDASG